MTKKLITPNSIKTGFTPKQVSTNLFGSYYDDPINLYHSSHKDMLSLLESRYSEGIKKRKEQIKWVY